MTQTTDIVMVGVAGRMGKKIVQAIASEPVFRLVQAVTHSSHLAIGQDAGLQAGVAPLGVTVAAMFSPVESQTLVVIDYSAPAQFLASLEFAVKHACALLVGTTGLTDSQRTSAEQAAKKIPLMLAPNTSSSMSVMAKLVRQATESLHAISDIELIETHHRHKKDAPSGSALFLADIVCQASGRSLQTDLVYDRHSVTAPRSKQQIGMSSVRGGDVVGEHSVVYFSDGERIEIKHTVTDRMAFAKGALRAGAWLAKQTAGLYSMADVSC